MTEVQKVSIGGYAFTLEVEAYEIAKQYLDELEAHYSPREGGAEVMEGFEERLAELLYEKCADDGVASVAEVQEIISILGKPSAIESEDDPQLKGSVAGDKRSGSRDKRHMFRDPSRKIIGGVCSGLAAYFNLDVVIIRIIFIALLLGGVFIDIDSIALNVFSPILYIALWIAMPEAKTVQQRWEIGITNPPASKRSEPVGSDLGRVLRIIMGCMLVAVGVGGMTLGLVALFRESFFSWMIHAGYIQIGDIDYSLFRDSSIQIYKALVILIWFLPMVGMMYGGVMMLFDLRSPRWRPGLVIFLLWFIAVVAFVVLTILALGMYFD